MRDELLNETLCFDLDDHGGRNLISTMICFCGIGDIVSGSFRDLAARSKVWREVQGQVIAHERQLHRAEIAKLDLRISGHILERLSEKLRDLGFVPMIFNFDKPDTKGLTDTIRLLANLSHFVIVDITNPRSAPLELQALVPDYMIPFVPIIKEGEEPFAMFADLQRYDWVLDPVIVYSCVDRLVEVLEEKIVKPAEAKFNELLTRRTKQLHVEII